MIPNEKQFGEVHSRTMGHLDSAIKLTRGLADIYSNTSMSPSDKEAAIKALHASVAGSPSTTSTEHEYHEAMANDPRYETPEAAEEKGNAMFKADQEKNNGA
jgi:hypothetical protein